MTKKEKFKILIDYILESEARSYYDYSLLKLEKYIDSNLSGEDEEYLNNFSQNYMDNIEDEEYLEQDDNKHIYVYAKLLQKHLKLNIRK